MPNGNNPEIGLGVEPKVASIETIGIDNTTSVGKNEATEAEVAATFSDTKEKNNEDLGSCTRIEVTPENAASVLNESLLQNEDIKNADLILVYRNNECYEKLNHDLESLLKGGKYGGKIVCIAIDKSIQKRDLSGSHLSTLKQLLNEYRCITDHTVKEWTNHTVKEYTYNEEIYNIADHYGQMINSEELCRDKNKHGGVISHFTEQTQKLSEACNKKGIKTIYLVDRAIEPRREKDWFLLEHGGLCEKEDGRKYLVGNVCVADTIERFEKQREICIELGWAHVLRGSKEHEEIKEDAKRYRLNMFPNQKVVFLTRNMKDNSLNENEIEIDYDTITDSDTCLLIVDAHGCKVTGVFKNSITYGGPRYYPNGGYEKLVHEDMNLGLNAENILKYLEEGKGEK